MEVVSFKICSKVAAHWRRGAWVFSSLKGEKKFNCGFGALSWVLTDRNIAIIR